MPTAEEFDSAAHELGTASVATSQLPSPLSRAIGPDVLAGGQLTAELTAMIGQTEGGCGLDASRLDELAELCTQRAEICRQYAADLARYHTAQRDHQWASSHWEAARNRYLDDPETQPWPGNRPTAPVMPVKPAAWVEV